MNACESDGRANHAPVAAAGVAVGAATEALISPSLPLTGEISTSLLYQPGLSAPLPDTAQGLGAFFCTFCIFFGFVPCFGDR